MKRLLYIFAFVAALIPFTAKADALSDLQMECPVEVSGGWLIQNASTVPQGAEIVLVINADAATFSRLKANPGEAQKRVRAVLEANNYSAALLSQVNGENASLIVDAINPDGSDAFTVTLR